MEGKRLSELLAQRRQWFEEYIRHVEQGATKPLQPGVRYTCPCCGYPTLSKRGGYNICRLCNWEDDGQDDPHAAEVWGGPNEAYSLSEARLNFKLYLIKYSPDKPTNRIGGNTNTALEQQAKRAIVDAFDAMVEESDGSMLQTLWQRVYENERILRNEKNRKYFEYQVQMKK
jgi:hypothetical protein